MPLRQIYEADLEVLQDGFFIPEPTTLTGFLCVVKDLVEGYSKTFPYRIPKALEPSLDYGEIVVQTRRSAKLINIIQEFIHKASLPFRQGCQIGNASIQIPRSTSVAEDFKHAIAEDQQARSRRDAARLSLEI